MIIYISYRARVWHVHASQSACHSTLTKNSDILRGLSLLAVF